MTSALAASVMVGAPSAEANTSATARNGVCEPTEFCLYWGPIRTGSVSDFSGSLSNYGTSQPTCYDFKGPGTGKGECVKNNAASAWNRRSEDAGDVRVYYNSYYGGSFDLVQAQTWRNLFHTYSDNASHKFL